MNTPSAVPLLGLPPVPAGEVAIYLRAARELIASLDTWTQKAAGRDAKGRECDPTRKAAVRRDSSGALRVAAKGNAELERAGYEALRAVLPAGVTLLSTYNDTHSHGDVIELWGRAIDRLESSR